MDAWGGCCRRPGAWTDGGVQHEARRFIYLHFREKKATSGPVILLPVDARFPRLPPELNAMETLSLNLFSAPQMQKTLVPAIVAIVAGYLVLAGTLLAFV